METSYFWQSDFCMWQSLLPSLHYPHEFCINSHSQWLIWKYKFQFLAEAVLLIINFILRWDTYIQNNITPATSSYYVQHPVTNSTLLTDDMTIFKKKKKNTLYLIHDSHSAFHRKMYIRLLVKCHLPHLTSCALTKSSLYFYNCHEQTCPIRTSCIPCTKPYVHFP
jgi:hypothetical protein